MLQEQNTHLDILSRRTQALHRFTRELSGPILVLRARYVCEERESLATSDASPATSERVFAPYGPNRYAASVLPLDRETRGTWPWAASVEF